MACPVLSAFSCSVLNIKQNRYVGGLYFSMIFGINKPCKHIRTHIGAPQADGGGVARSESGSSDCCLPSGWSGDSALFERRRTHIFRNEFAYVQARPRQGESQKAELSILNSTLGKQQGQQLWDIFVAAKAAIIKGIICFNTKPETFSIHTHVGTLTRKHTHTPTHRQTYAVFGPKDMSMLVNSRQWHRCRHLCQLPVGITSVVGNRQLAAGRCILYR